MAKEIQIPLPSSCNRQKLSDELDGVLGQGAVASIVWTDPVLVQLTREPSSTERDDCELAAANHDGTAENLAEEQAKASAAAERAADEAGLRALKAKARARVPLTQPEVTAAVELWLRGVR